MLNNLPKVIWPASGRFYFGSQASEAKLLTKPHIIYWAESRLGIRKLRHRKLINLLKSHS